MQANEKKGFRVVVERGERVRDDGEFVIGDSIGYLMNYAAKTLARNQAEALAEHGAHIGQWAVLMFLWAENGQTQSQLSRHVVIENATMVRTLDRMERDGLVSRVRSTEDRRRIHIHLTERGWELRDRLIPCAIATNEEATKDFTAEEKVQLEGFLKRMISSLEDHGKA